ncbi:YqgQ family protein [Weissella soli]|uniref:Uncharacterized protein YqgQ n=1 Tax=Weissella soli TaxID=155866 RepID=A0A288Q7E7_9LACO|nr:YqgQ family protein [Weissella soli]AOT56915.1 hypothetical protein WSWS_01311 [Weissella soli]MCT8395569.1 DUF910 family protein [Weissella soli]NKY83366.1 YqgQ family protein [Weissella soli]QEA35701.1 DUF910 family protein [Weissella soli]RDL05342.1 uncharacterized protein YqgQ [Weissella soli]
MKYQNFFDVLELLKKYDTYVHVGKRLWDIEFAALEIDNMWRSGLIDNADYAKIKLVLAHEHEVEVKRERGY